MLRRSKDDVLSLPPKIRTWLPVDVPKGTGVRDMRKVVELLIGDTELAPGSTIDERRLRGRLLHAVTQGAAGAGRREGESDDRSRDRRGRAR